MTKQLILVLATTMVAGSALAVGPAKFGKRPTLQEQLEGRKSTGGSGVKSTTQGSHEVFNGKARVSAVTSAFKVVGAAGALEALASVKDPVRYEQVTELDTNFEPKSSEQRSISMPDLVERVTSTAEGIMTDSNSTSAQKDAVKAILELIDASEGKFDNSPQVNGEAIKFIVDALDTIEKKDDSPSDPITDEDVAGYATTIRAGLKNSNGLEKISLSKIYEKFDKDARERQKNCTKG